MIEEIGIITAVDKDHIWVETEIKNTCGSCHAEENCGTGVVAKAFSPKKEQLILRCRQPAKVGQKVRLGIDENSLVGASALVYLLPLVALVGTALVMQALLPLLGLVHEAWIIGAAFFATFLCFTWIKRSSDGDSSHRFQPKLLAILPAEEDLIKIKPI